jgi:peptide/nickel transport system substrate-binding protein
MGGFVRVLAAVAGVAMVASAGVAWAQKSGGILKIHQRDSPASASIHEEATISTVLPFMGIFNNLVIYKQDAPQNSLATIEPELATSWSWNAEKTKLTFKLRDGVKWHDGKPFTANDVKCTFDMLTGKAKDSLRKNPRASWYTNLESVSVSGNLEATFNLKRPQPALLALLASGYTPVYACHVSPRDMRLKPIGTGPFKFVEFKANEYIKVTKNPDYWKKGRPLLDGIEYTIVTNRSTAILAFIANKFDMLFPFDLTPALMKDVKGQSPNAICELHPTNVSNNLIVNPEAAPFNNPDIRKAMAMALDRKAFIDILFEGQADVGGAMLPPPAGVWGMPKEMLETLPGYGPDIKKNREAARALMQKAGYGPDKRLNVKIATRNIAVYRDPAVILIDQLKEIFIDGELEVIETANWHAKIARKDYQVGMNLTGSGVDDPDQQFYENYMCGSERNVTGYCNKDLDAMFDQQSSEPDQEKRKKLVWEIDRKLQEEGARPIINHNRAATCWHPQLKGLKPMVNSIYNGWRFEDISLDR